MNHELFYVSGLGVTLVCEDRKSVLFWIDWLLDRGEVPTIERITS